MAGTLGYHLAPGISNRFMLQMGAELSYGVMRIRSTSVLDNAIDPGLVDNSLEGQSSERQLAFIAPALSAGLLFEWKPDVIVNIRYYHTFFASDTDWFGFRLGLLRTFW